MFNYFPKIGSKVKLREFHNYMSRGLNPWAWLRVEILDKTLGIVGLTLDPETRGVDTLGEKDPGLINVPASEIEPPLGWLPVYEICQDSVAGLLKPYSWLKEGRGILPWISQDLGCAGRRMFSPGDRTDKPHWSMAACDDPIYDPERFIFLRQWVTDVKPPRDLKKDFTYDRKMKEWWRNEPISRDELEKIYQERPCASASTPAT